MAYDTFEELGGLALPVERQKLNDMLSYLYLKMQGGIGTEEVDTLSFSKLTGDSLVLGGDDNINGEFEIKDAADNVIVSGTKDGIAVQLPARGGSTLTAPLWIYDKQFMTPILLCATQFTDGNPLEGTWYMYGNVLYFKRSDGTNEHGFTLDTMAGTIDFDTKTLTYGATELSYRGNKVWDAGNDGSGSGLDADTVDGNHIASGTWTPTFAGFSTAPTGVTARYRKIGNVCECWVRMLTAGTSDANTFAFSLPFTAATVAGMIWGSTDVRAVDNGAAVTTACMCQVLSGGTTASLYTTLGGGGWTTTGNKHAQWVHFTYETE